MRTLMTALVAAAAGAAAMYFLDAEHGRRRRSAARDRALSIARDANRALADLQPGPRMAGRMGARMGGSDSAQDARRLEDRRLRDRIRAQLGHRIDRPRDVEVVVNDGDVSLRGRVRDTERESLLQAVAAMPGVRHVHDRLEPADAVVEPWGGRMPVPADARHAAQR